MFEDANKTAEHTGSFTVDDLAELVADAVELDKLTTDDFPAIMKLIVEKSSQMITERVLDQLSRDMPPRLEQSAQPAQNSAPANAPTPVDAAPASAAPTAPTPDDTLPAPSTAPPQPAAAHQEVPTASPAPVEPVAKDLRPMHWTQPNPVQAAEFAPYEMPERAAHRILVAVKHVGVLNDGFQIEDNRSLPADSFDHKINEWDEAAMEEALLLSEKLGDCEVVAVTIGDDGAEVSLRKAMAMGADRGVRIWDDSLQEPDPLTIARALAGIARLEKPDLFLCGVQSSDLGHGSTGIALAGIMDVAHSASVVSCEWDGSKAIKLTRELEGGAQHEFCLSVPAVLTIQTGSNQPRYATMRMIKQAKKKPIAVVDGSSVDDGSSGFVIQRMYEPTTDQATMLEGGAEDVAAFIVAKIKETTGE